ncbi:hypothetical protein DTL42_06225 [Bremerella cremea]|uniref:Cytochrome c n=2 Tax=Bremerella cremea TaxID=1031537 RepID=A0A368KWI9_9BACT|nr:hypothetical protein DTL42_06225 [Bremerella cremea]
MPVFLLLFVGEKLVMKKSLLVATGLLSVVMLCGVVMADKEKDAKYSTEEIMKKAFKGKDALLGKVVKGEADEEQSKLFLEMVEALGKNEPHKGSEESWKKKTSALLVAAKETVEKKEGAAEKLKKAANCKACHDEHK